MKIRGTVEFNEDEREVFDRALKGYATALEDPPREGKKETEYYPVKTLRNRIVEHEELFNAQGLGELESTLVRLVWLWTPQTTVEYWQELGAPGTDAIAGLARERQLAIERVKDALDITRSAQTRLYNLRLDHRLQRL